MPSQTSPKNLPYPLGTDRVMDGDDMIRKLAQSVDNMVQGGQISPNIVTGGTAVQTTVTFPVAYAAGSTPFVAATPVASNASTNIAVSVTSIGATSMVVSCVRASSGTQSVQWVAAGPIAAVS